MLGNLLYLSFVVIMLSGDVISVLSCLLCSYPSYIEFPLAMVQSFSLVPSLKRKQACPLHMAGLLLMETQKELKIERVARPLDVQPSGLFRRAGSTFIVLTSSGEYNHEHGCVYVR